MPVKRRRDMEGTFFWVVVVENIFFEPNIFEYNFWENKKFKDKTM